MPLNFFAALFAAALPILAPAPAGSKPINPNPTATSFTFVVAGDDRPAKDTCDARSARRTATSVTATRRS